MLKKKLLLTFVLSLGLSAAAVAQVNCSDVKNKNQDECVRAKVNNNNGNINCSDVKNKNKDECVRAKANNNGNMNSNNLYESSGNFKIRYMDGS